MIIIIVIVLAALWFISTDFILFIDTAPRTRNSIAISSFSSASKLFAGPAAFSSMSNLAPPSTSFSTSPYGSPSRRVSLTNSLSLAGYNIPEMGDAGIDYTTAHPASAISPTSTLHSMDSSGDGSIPTSPGPVSPYKGVVMRHKDLGVNPFVRSNPSPRSSQIYQETMFSSDVRTMSVSSLHSEAATIDAGSGQRRSQRRGNQFVTAVSIALFSPINQLPGFCNDRVKKSWRMNWE